MKLIERRLMAAESVLPSLERCHSDGVVLIVDDDTGLVHARALELGMAAERRDRFAYQGRRACAWLPEFTCELAAVAFDQASDFMKARKASWARPIGRIFEADPLLRPRCGETLEVLAVVTGPPVVDRILRYVRDAGIEGPFDDAREPPHHPTEASANVDTFA